MKYMFETVSFGFRLRIANLFTIGDLAKDDVLERHLAGDAERSFQEMSLESLPPFAHAHGLAANGLCLRH
ncbi:hypothetical protein [Edaphobacter modestus]|uniref:hypothetical protein n=1 Tax=Edaphobacter modestus TaxID=388466 RepID=UPI001F5F6F1A|nr:hypothetical protein [Edaphobacter modestus]